MTRRDMSDVGDGLAVKVQRLARLHCRGIERTRWGSTCPRVDDGDGRRFWLVVVAEDGDVWAWCPRCAREAARLTLTAALDAADKDLSHGTGGKSGP